MCPDKTNTENASQMPDQKKVQTLNPKRTELADNTVKLSSSGTFGYVTENGLKEIARKEKRASLVIATASIFAIR